MKILYISWSKYHSRTERLAKALGASVCYVWRLGRVSLPLLPLKYLLQLIETIAILIRERPDAVIAQTPPVFVALLSWAYSSLTGARFIIDAHSGSFLSRKWKWFFPLHRWCSSRAQVTIAHVRTLKRLVGLSGVHVMNIGFVGDGLPESIAYPLPNGFNVVVPSSFKDDEPVESILLAALSLPEVRFFMTGDQTRVSPGLRAIKPENVVFTGYLSVPRYFGLLEGSDAVLVLTNQDHTFQCGAEEAVLLGRPVVTSNTQSLRDAFHRGVVFVENSPESIATGIQFTRNHLQWLKEQIHVLKMELDRDWEQKCLELRSIIHTPDHEAIGKSLERVVEVDSAQYSLFDVAED